MDPEAPTRPVPATPEVGPKVSPPRYSLRARLLAAVAVVALVGLLVADFATYAALKSFLVDRIDSSLDSANRPLTNLLLEQTDPERQFGSDATSQAALAAAAPGAYVEVRNANNVAVVSGSTRGDYATAVPSLPRRFSGLSSPDDVRYMTVEARGSGPHFRLRVEQLPEGGMLLVALPLDEVNRTLHQLFLIELVVTGAALVAAVAVGLWLVRIGLRPLRDIETTASSIAGGDLSLRVPEDDRTEVGRLGSSLNTMLRHIEDAFARRAASEEQLRQFVADASHELRTPVSAVSAYAELFERGANERPADLARVIRGIRVETARMQTLIDDLLLLARLDEGRPLAAEPVDLVAVLDDAVDAARVVGPEWPITFESHGPVEVVGDAMALRQVVDNLLVNVRTHTPPGTPAAVRLLVDRARPPGTVVLEVADEGPGLDAGHLERVFERFYRADPSRSRLRGGSGLGLAVVAALVGAQHGHVEVVSEPGSGATFRVHLASAPDDVPAPAEPPEVPPGVPVTRSSAP